MEAKMTFDEAFNAIEKIVQEIEQETVPLDALAEKVREAKTLISFCNEKLRNIEAELEDKEITP